MQLLGGYGKGGLPAAFVCSLGSALLLVFPA